MERSAACTFLHGLVASRPAPLAWTGPALPLPVSVEVDNKEPLSNTHWLLDQLSRSLSLSRRGDNSVCLIKPSGKISSYHIVTLQIYLITQDGHSHLIFCFNQIGFIVQINITAQAKESGCG